MTDWYLWDGESQRGPMDRRELDNRIQYHPNPNLVWVWRHGFSEWQKVEEAFDAPRKSPLGPSTFERPLERTVSPKRQNFVAQHWRGEYPLGISYWIIGFVGNIAAFVVIATVSAFTGGTINPIGILLFYLSLSGHSWSASRSGNQLAFGGQRNVGLTTALRWGNALRGPAWPKLWFA